MRTWYPDTWGPMKTDDTIDLDELHREILIGDAELQDARRLREQSNRLLDSAQRRFRRVRVALEDLL